MGQRIAKILARLDRIATFGDLTDEGIGGELCEIATDGVLESIIAEESPDGTRWPDLSPAYEAWKRTHYPGRPMGVKDFVMAQPSEVAGDVSVAPGEASVIYGKTEKAREEAVYFSKDRPFWGLTEASRRKVSDRLARRLRNKVRG